ncbi:IclR family transcriptional regulator [Natrialbaceae archaeon A-gly3]
MTTDDFPKRWSSVTETVFEIIEALDELDEATVTELANRLDLSPSTVHNHLGALYRLGYVVKDGGEYRLSLRFLNLGMSTRNRRMMEVVQSAVDDLARETSEAAWAATLENDWVYFVCSARGEDAIQAYGDLGARRRPHAIASGKAILAHLPEEEVHKIIDRIDLKEYTENTITSKDVLFEEFEQIREQGYALNRGERLEGGRAVACAILQEGKPLGSIGISGPAHRFQGKQFTEELPSAVLGAKNIIELNLSSSS